MTAVLAALVSAAWAQNAPVISLVANAEGENPVIAPNTRTWGAADFRNNQLPTSLDGVSVTVNGKAAYLYYISPTQVNILASASFSVKAQAASPSFFNINGGPYVVAQHSADYSLVGPGTLLPGATTPAKPGEIVVLYATGFGPTTPAAVSGSLTQTGALSPGPTVQIGGLPATVQAAGLISPGLYQLNVVVRANAPTGDLPLTATIGGVAATPVGLLAVQGSGRSTQRRRGDRTRC